MKKRFRVALSYLMTALVSVCCWERGKDGVGVGGGGGVLIIFATVSVVALSHA